MIDKGYLLGERYRIIDTLGEGGMANVYLAEDIILQRKVAVKVLRLDLQKEPQTEARFQREALATSELSHPNIVSVLDVGTDQGLPYMVMEYVDGPDLKQYIHDNSPLDLHEVIRIMDQILSAVALAHKHNVIHRDLKPQNILMDKRGNVKIADFGIAVALNQSSITQTNSVMGSVHYMSPEQTRGGMVTKQSDIYSLGIILYELITGKVPFDGDTPVAIALKHAQEPIPSIRKNDPEVPQALENVVLKATSKDPRDRYASAQEMQSDLDTSLDYSRRDEPVFVPDHNVNEDETIILPGFKPKKDVEEPAQKQEAVAEEEEAEPKRNLWQNIVHHKLWFIFSGLATLVIVLIMVFALSIKNNETVATIHVPDVTDMNEVSAKDRLRKSGLKVGDVSRKKSDNVNNGRIIKTMPAAGDEIEKGKTVDLVVSKGAGMIKVPNVTNSNYEIAATKLEKLGFDVIRENQYSMSVPQDLIISQSVTAGAEVKPEQTTITLVVSQGKPPRPKRKKKTMIKLKDLKNYSLKSVQDYAKDNDLTLQINQEYSNDIEKGMVISTEPGAGTQIERGSTLTINVSKGRKEEENTNITKTFTVNYVEPKEDTDDSSSSDISASSKPTKKGNHVQIYIKDDDHSLGNIYRDLYITHDMSFSVPFSLKNGEGQLRVVRDGQTILNEKVTK